MTDLLTAIGLTAASMAVMYAVCIRPMRRRARPPAAARGDPQDHAAHTTTVQSGPKEDPLS